MAKKNGLTFIQKKKRFSPQLIQEILSMMFAVCITVIFAFLLIYAFGMRISVIGVSMEPVLYNSQEVLINRLTYNLSSPEQGDVIVFLPNGNENSHYYLKRVVAVPGQTIQIIEGYLYIDGIREEEDERFDKMADAGIANHPITLSTDEFFVLGDDRNNSEDSRSGNIGVVRKEVIIGKAWFKLPFDGENMGLVE